MTFTFHGPVSETMATICTGAHSPRLQFRFATTDRSLVGLDANEKQVEIDLVVMADIQANLHARPVRHLLVGGANGTMNRLAKMC